MRTSFTLKATITAPTPAQPLQVQRTRARTTTSRYLVAAGLGFLLISLSGSLLIDAELKGLYHFIFRYLTLPIIALCYGVGWIGMPRWRESVSLLKASTAPALVAVVILFTCSGLVNYFNVLLGNGAPVRFGGPITRLSYTSGRSGRGYYLVISDTTTGQPREFHITQPEYLNLRVGYAYVRTMKQGGLGYAYDWRH